MTDQNEIQLLIEAARQRGAIIRTQGSFDPEIGQPVTAVMVRRGIQGIGSEWMPLIQAAERLREFLARPKSDQERIFALEKAVQMLAGSLYLTIGERRYAEVCNLVGIEPEVKIETCKHGQPYDDCNSCSTETIQENSQ